MNTGVTQIRGALLEFKKEKCPFIALPNAPFNF